MNAQDIPAYMAQVGAAARAASTEMARAGTRAKNATLTELARLLRARPMPGTSPRPKLLAWPRRWWTACA
jgi:hypothetical protein